MKRLANQNRASILERINRLFRPKRRRWNHSSSNERRRSAGGDPRRSIRIRVAAAPLHRMVRTTLKTVCPRRLRYGTSIPREDCTCTSRQTNLALAADLPLPRVKTQPNPARNRPTEFTRICPAETHLRNRERILFSSAKVSPSVDTFKT